MRLRILTMLLSICVWVMCADAAMAARPAGQGPRLSDADLLQAMNLEFPGMEAVAKAVAAGDQKAALDALATFFRHRKEPYDFCPKAETDPDAASAAEEVLKHHFTDCGISYSFPGAVDWYYNPTTAPGSKYPRDNELQWGLNRHHEFETLARAYQSSGDEKYAREFAQLLQSWIHDCPVPDERGMAGARFSLANDRVRYSNFDHLGCFADGVSHFAFRQRPFAAGLAQVMDRACSLSAPRSHRRQLAHDGNERSLSHRHARSFCQGSRDLANHGGGMPSETDESASLSRWRPGRTHPGLPQCGFANMLAIPRVAKAYGQKLPADYIAGLEKMFAYDMWIMQPDRKTPDWNDSDHCDITSMMSEGAEFFPQRQDFLWIASDGKQGSPPDHTSHFFPWAGQVIMRSGWDREALFLGFEVGPFGAGHQHEDKLSIEIVTDQAIAARGRHLRLRCFAVASLCAKFAGP